MTNLTGRVAVVTGGARGIGAGIVKKLADHGASIALLDYELGEDAENIKDYVKNKGARALAIMTDVSSSASVDKAIQQIVDEMGRIDILVNCAGICPFSDLQSITDEIWMRTINTNLSGPFFLTRAIAPIMKKQMSGSVVNISTVSTYIGTPHQVHYIASKSGVNGLTRSLAVALAPFNIRVNAVAPGGVHTQINANWDEQREAWIRSGVPLPKEGGNCPAGRIGTPEDIANGVLYLVSDEASYVTGVYLPVDGGVLIS